MRRTTRILGAIAAATGFVLTAACDRASQRQTDKAATIAGDTSAAGAELGFDVEISLSAKAAGELAARKEGIMVSASYSGDPTPSAQSRANEIGRIDLGRELISVLPPGGKVRVTGADVTPERLGWIAGAPMVNVNVYSARLSSPDNLLSCDFIDGPVAAVSLSQTNLMCSLITEQARTTAYPK